MEFLKHLIRKTDRDIQEFVIIKDTFTSSGAFLKKDSTFIIDTINNNNVYIHFPNDTKSLFKNEYNEECISINELFKIAMRYNDNQDLHEKIENLLETNKILSDRNDDLEMFLDRYKAEEKEETQKSKKLGLLLDKTTEEKSIYKKVINSMCDKFGIDQKDVLSIIDDIKNDKSQQRELKSE